MKSEILNNKKAEQSSEIDWSICQIVISKGIYGTIVVLTNGKHKDYVFEGTAIVSTNMRYECCFSKKWNKLNFQPINEPLDIRFHP